MSVQMHASVPYINSVCDCSIEYTGKSDTSRCAVQLPSKGIRWNSLTPTGRLLAQRCDDSPARSSEGQCFRCVAETYGTWMPMDSFKCPNWSAQMAFTSFSRLAWGSHSRCGATGERTDVEESNDRPERPKQSRCSCSAEVGSLEFKLISSHLPIFPASLGTLPR